METKNYTIADAQSAILFVRSKYGNDVTKTFGVDLAKIIEKMMRLETAHFTTKQYKETGSAGMEDGHWANLPAHTDVDFVDNQDHHTGHFIVWNSVNDFADYLAKYIMTYKGDWARWNTTVPAGKIAYAAKVNSVTSHFV